jgi:hypothetical protein
MTTALMEHNPLLRRPLLAVLELSRRLPDAERGYVEREASKRIKAQGQRMSQTAATLVDILVRNGALTEQVLVDGRPYTGSYQDLRLDGEISEDRDVERLVSITAQGEDMLDEYSDSNRLARLLREKPHYLTTYINVLNACLIASEAGCSRAELEGVIEAQLEQTDSQSDQSSGVRRVYPQFFLDSLEQVGGIVWRGSWQITEVGKEAVAASREGGEPVPEILSKKQAKKQASQCRNDAGCGFD